jgi:hypothetical protein
MNFFSLDVKWRVRGWAKKYANSSLYGKLKMGGEKTYYIEYSWSICDVKIDDFTEY